MIRILENPIADDIGDTVEAFLEMLNGPTCIILDGEDNSRSRVLVTLLHGNEPSGVMALFRWLKERRQPVVRMICIVASVKTALQPPLFHYRTLPGVRDINRCFAPPYNDEPGELAETILGIIRQHQPEAIIDIHNTSGSGPCFGVATHKDKKHEALTSLFSNQLVITHLKLGALMDISDAICPAVTIEAGGRLEQRSHDAAWHGLVRYFTEKNALTLNPQQKPIELMAEPVRIELAPRTSVCFAKNANDEFDITLKHNVDNNNFRIIDRDTHIGWVSKKELANFSVKSLRGNSPTNKWLRLEGNKLYPATTIKPFMITTNPVIAIDDCLFYCVPIK